MTLRSLLHAEGEGERMVTPARVGLAFGLCLASGLATSVGALSPFLVKVANSKFMAFALGISSGVMIYVSFVELFAGESMEEFHHAGFEDTVACRYSTLTFFGGLFFMWLLDKLVHLLTNKEVMKKASKFIHGFTRRNPNAQEANLGESRLPPHAERAYNKDLEANKAFDTAQELACTTKDKTLHAGDDESKFSSDGFENHSLHDQEPPRAPCPRWRQACAEYTHKVLAIFDSHDYDPALSTHHDDIIHEAEQEAAEALMTDPYAHLGRTGLLTALAIGIHNVPEGLATFIATLSSVKAGGAMAVAIAIHNIPEGIAVSMPYYYATGSRYKALLYGTLAGFPLPVGGLIAYGIVSSDAEASSLMFGLLFSLAAGMMVAVVFMEILPNAYLFDPRNIWVGRGVALGFAIMAASLLLFGVGE